MGLAYSGDTPYVLYYESATARITLARHDGSGWSALGPGPDPPYQLDEHPWADLAFDSKGSPYVVEKNLSNSAVVVSRLAHGAWEPVGGLLPSTTTRVSYCAIAIDSSDTPYVAYAVTDPAIGVAVLKYASGQWSSVGTPGAPTSGR